MNQWLPSLTVIMLASAGFARPTLADPIVYTRGHTDISPVVSSGVLVGNWRNDEAALPGPEWIPAAEVLAVGIFDPDSTDPGVVAPPLARPSASQWDFLGVAAGEPLYIFPSSGTPASLPYIGWGAESPTLVGQGFDRVRITLTAMAAPVGGNFSLYASSSNVFMATANGISAADTLTLSLGVHDHYNMAFTQPGIYDLTFGFEGLDGATGPVVMTGGDTYRFEVQVVPEPGTVALAAAGLAGLAALARRRRANRGSQTC